MIKIYPKFLLISIFLNLPLLLNSFWWHSSGLGIVLGFFYVFFYGRELGQCFWPRKNAHFQVWAGVLGLISAISLVGAVIYQIYALKQLVLLGMIVLIPAVILLLKIKKSSVGLLTRPLSLDSFSTDLFTSYFASPFLSTVVVKCISNFKKFWQTAAGKKITLLTLFYLVLTGINFGILVKARTMEAVRTVWQVVPPEFFWTYFLGVLFLLILIWLSKKFTLPLVLIMIQTFLSLGVALIIFPLGYGFDSFIHQAAEKVILTQGFIAPKTLYYTGQYSLVIFLAQLLQVSVVWVDKLLVLILSSIYLPLIIFHVLQKNWQPKLVLILILGLLALPWGQFIVTTPQALANFFLLMIIFCILALPDFPPRILFFLSLATLTIHPLTGVGAIFCSFFVWYRQSNLEKRPKISRKIIEGIILLLASISLPLLFSLNSTWSGQLKTVWSSVGWRNVWSFSSLIPYLENRFHLIHDLIYFYGFNLDLILLGMILTGIILLLRKKQLKHFWPYLAGFGGLFINYLLLKILLDFPSLIYYEKGNYADRVLEISFYFLLPFFLFSFYYLLQKIASAKLGLKISAGVFLTAIITTSLYLNYPRHDNYTASHEFNVSAYDISAVHYINENAQDHFVVLANQAVSAAALREFGFKKYYQTTDGMQFYYPVPTGSQLYDYYLKMVYEEPSYQTAQEVMNWLGVKELYLVVNNYWHESEKIIIKAQENAAEKIEIAKGKIVIFRY